MVGCVIVSAHLLPFESNQLFQKRSVSLERNIVNFFKSFFQLYFLFGEEKRVEIFIRSNSFRDFPKSSRYYIDLFRHFITSFSGNFHGLGVDFG